MLQYDAIIKMIKKHEGSVMTEGRHKPYKCSSGKLTIGYGRNIEDNGISEEEALKMLDNDVLEVLMGLKTHLSLKCWAHLSQVRRVVVADMCYNLGLIGFLKFKKMVKALEEYDYQEAAKEMLDSVWAGQVGRRANELAFMMKEDEYQ